MAERINAYCERSPLTRPFWCQACDDHATPEYQPTWIQEVSYGLRAKVAKVRFISLTAAT